MRLLTPPGLSGVAVVIAAAEECARVLQCLRSRRGRTWQRAPLAPPRLAVLHLDGVPVDDVLVVDRGVHGIELHVHGAPSVLEALRATFPFAEPVALAPAAKLLREALSPQQLDLALEQGARGGGFASLLAQVRRLPDAERFAAVSAAVERSRVARAHSEPQRVVLAGAQNAGKSTLMNRLLFRERVLTGPLPGLTRDPVVEATALAGYPYELADTAGEGPVSSSVDARAVASGRALRSAGLVLLVVDQGRGPDNGDRALAAAGAIVVANKCDLEGPPWPGDLRCDLRLSCTVMGPEAVRGAVGELLRRARGLPQAGPVGGAVAWTDAELQQLQALAP